METSNFRRWKSYKKVLDDVTMNYELFIACYTNPSSIGLTNCKTSETNLKHNAFRKVMPCVLHNTMMRETSRRGLWELLDLAFVKDFFEPELLDASNGVFSEELMCTRNENMSFEPAKEELLEPWNSWLQNKKDHMSFQLYSSSNDNFFSVC